MYDLNERDYNNNLTFSDKRFYMPNKILDRSLYKPGEKIPVVMIVNHNIMNNGANIANENSLANSHYNLTQAHLNMIPPQNQPPIDAWIPKPEDKLFNHIKGAIIAPIHKYYGLKDDDPAVSMLDYFFVSAKRCYNSDSKMKDGIPYIGFRDHCTNYINYFEKFYDTDYQLLNMYSKIKYMIDCQTKSYNLNIFLHDLWKYFINPQCSYTSQILNFYIDKMNNEQYNLKLDYKNNKSPVLEYTEYHAKILMKISIMQNMMIPLITHFITKNRISQNDIKTTLLKAFDLLFQITKLTYNIDLGSKLFETTFSNVTKSANNNSVLFDMQNIRGRNTTSHSIETVENIIMQIIPKYTYSKNIIHFNYDSIIKDIKYKITDVPYEYAFVALSSSNRDEDNNSECDKFEAHAAKLNEAILIQTQVNCEDTMKRIELKYGPFDEKEILFYKKELTKDNKPIVNNLQKTLVNYLFAKEFDDPQSIRIVNIRQYIILIIAAKRVLQSYKLAQLPYIIGGKVNRVVARKNVNKKELQKITSSKYYPIIHEKYKNEKIEKDVILFLISQILSSEFQTIDYYHPEDNGLIINIIPDLISEEICRFIMLI